MLSPQDYEDLEQEYELLRLSGVARPSRRFLRLRLESTYRTELLIDDLTPDDEGPEPSETHHGHQPWTSSQTHAVSPERLAFLLSWTTQQDPIVQERVYRYLAGDIPLSKVLVVLQNRGLLHEAEIAEEKRTAPHQHSAKQFLLRCLPATKDQMIHALTPVHSTERPAATVRQFIRRALQNKEITYDEVTQLYHRA